jgi:hypothetical protein
MIDRRKQNRYTKRKNYILDKVIEICKDKYIKQSKFLEKEKIKMKVLNMVSSKGNRVANQFIIEGCIIDLSDDQYRGEMFQSYESNIAFMAFHCNNTGNTYKIFLDEKYWDYSVTTDKYRNMFLGETKKETQAKIDSGEYKLVNLN